MISLHLIIEVLEQTLKMTHLLIRHHNGDFVGYMDTFLPNWRLLQDELNRGGVEWGSGV